MRKLVIESDKLNVITAYSGREAIDSLDRFPAVDGAILNASIPDIPCHEVITAIRKRAPNMPIIVVQSAGGPECPGANHFVDSFDPVPLLELLRRLFPRAVEAIKQQDDRLSIEENLA